MIESPTTLLTLLLLTLLTCFSSCALDLRVYIHERDLHSYFKGTQESATVEGHYIDIIRCGEDYVLPDGSLQLSSTLKVFDTSSCSGRPLDPVGNPLPPIPYDITAVTINWRAENTTVEYFLDVDAHPEDHFEMIGVTIPRAGFIPQLLSEFQLKFDCHPSSVGLGQLKVNITTISHSTTGKKKELTSTFHFDKICEGEEFDSHPGPMLRRAAGVEGSGGGPDLEPSVTLSPGDQTLSSNVMLMESSSIQPEATPTTTQKQTTTSLQPSLSPTMTSLFPSTPSSSLSPPTTSETPPLTSEPVTSSLSDVIFMSLTSSMAADAVSTSTPPHQSSQPLSPSSSLVESTSTVPALSPSPSLAESSSAIPTPSSSPSSTVVSSPLPESSSPVSSLQSSSSPSLSSSSPVHLSPSPSQTLSMSSLLSTVQESSQQLLSPSSSPVLATTSSSAPSQPLTPSPSPSLTTILSSSLAPTTSSALVSVTMATTTVDTSLLSTTTTVVVMTTMSPQETSTFVSPSPSLSAASPSSMMMMASSLSSSVQLSSSDMISPSLSPSPPSSPSPSPSLSSTGVAPPLSTEVLSSSVEVEVSSPVLSSMLLPSVSPGAQRNGTLPEESKLGQLLIIAFAPVVAVLVLAICILICCICCCACKRRKKEPRRVFSDDPLDLPVRYSREVHDHELEESFSKAAGPPLTLWMALQWGTVSSLPASIQSIIKRYTVDRRSLSIISTANREESGAIVRGQWSDPAEGDKGVLMKMLTGFEKQYGHRDEIVHFVDLATLLCGRDHPNVHKVLKVSVEDNYVPLVIYPLAEYGNLHHFLTFCRTTPSESPLKPDSSHKMNFALQILSAMTYLSNEGIVHPDLALRNCLLDTGYSVKVSDGALSQLFFPDCYCNVKGSVRPARWAAIETLRQGHLTSLSNVWSYGVTIWEIMTLGEMPYSDINDRSVVSNLMMGQRLPKPEDCLDTMYDVMQRCWQEEPSNRLPFDALYPQVSAISGKDATFPTFGSSHSIPAVTVSRQSTPTSRNGTAIQPIPQFVPVVPAGEGERVPVRQTSSLSVESMPTKRDSLQPDKLSITFSVLSGDLLSEGGGSSSSESEGEEEQDPELLEADLIDKFMPSLRREQPSSSSGDEPTRKISTDELLTPTSTLTSTSGGGIKLEDTLKYSRLPSTALSPGPFSTSTLTSRLSPCETHSCSSSQYGPSITRSDETPVPGVSSPSPDLTSKASTIGDETMSIASNQLLAGPYHYSAPSEGNGRGEAVSKTSTLDSMYTAAAPPPSSTANAYPLQSNHLYSQHLNGGSGTTEYGTTNSRSPLTNGHPPVKANGDVIKTAQSNHSDAMGVSSENALNGVVLRDGASERLTSRESATSRTSFGLGLGDLSSDLFSAFDSWKT